jgi:hypothetical protein
VPIAPVFPEPPFVSMCFGLASPRSQTFVSPVSTEIMMLSGFRSRWQRSNCCAWRSAFATWIPISSARGSSTFPSRWRIS